MRRGRNVFLALVAAAIALELGLRAAGGLVLRSRANALEGGFAEAPGAVRMLHIGESTTFGLKVKPEEAYPEVTARILAERYPGMIFKSFNRGVPGLTTAAMLRSLPEKLALIRPRIVTFCAGANDHSTRLNREISRGQGMVPPEAHVWLSRFRIYKLLHWTKARLTPNFRLERGEILYDDRTVFDTVLNVPEKRKIAERVSATFRANIREMVRLSRGAGSEVLLVGYIHNSPLNGLLENLAKELNVGYVSVFLPKELRTPDLFIADGWHPSARGHRHIAERVAEKVRDLGLLSMQTPSDQPCEGAAPVRGQPAPIRLTGRIGARAAAAAASSGTAPAGPS